MEEMRETACDLARKAVIVAERTLGLDNQETILNWLNWALCEHGKGETNRALGFIIHVLNIWRNLFGEGHPDEVTMMVLSFRVPANSEQCSCDATKSPRISSFSSMVRKVV